MCRYDCKSTTFGINEKLGRDLTVLLWYSTKEKGTLDERARNTYLRIPNSLMSSRYFSISLFFR